MPFKGLTQAFKAASKATKSKKRTSVPTKKVAQGNSNPSSSSSSSSSSSGSPNTGRTQIPLRRVGQSGHNQRNPHSSSSSSSSTAVRDPRGKRQLHSGSDEDESLISKNETSGYNSEDEEFGDFVSYNSADGSHDQELQDFTSDSTQKPEAPAVIPNSTDPNFGNILNSIYDGTLITSVFGFFTTSQGKEWMTNTGATYLFPEFILSAAYQGVDEWIKYGDLVEEIKLHHAEKIIKGKPRADDSDQVKLVRKQHVAIQEWKDHIGDVDNLFEGITFNNNLLSDVELEADTTTSPQYDQLTTGLYIQDMLQKGKNIRSVKMYSEDLINKYIKEELIGLDSSASEDLSKELKYDPNSPSAIKMRRKVWHKFFWERNSSLDSKWRSSFSDDSKNLYETVNKIVDELYAGYIKDHKLKPNASDEERTAHLKGCLNFKFYAFCEVLRKYDEIQKEELIKDMKRFKKKERDNHWKKIQDAVDLAVTNANSGEEQYKDNGIYSGNKDALIESIYDEAGTNGAEEEVVKDIIAREIANKIMEKQEDEVDALVSPLITFDENVLILKQGIKATIATAGAILTTAVVTSSLALAGGAVGKGVAALAGIGPIVFTFIGVLKSVFHIVGALGYTAKILQTDLAIKNAVKETRLTAEEENECKVAKFVRTYPAEANRLANSPDQLKAAIKRAESTDNFKLTDKFIDEYKKEISPKCQELEKKREGYVKERNEHLKQAGPTATFTGAVGGVMLANTVTLNHAGAGAGIAVGVFGFCLGMYGFVHKLKERYWDNKATQPKPTADNFKVHKEPENDFKDVDPAYLSLRGSRS